MSVPRSHTNRNGRTKPLPGVAFYCLEGVLSAVGAANAVSFILSNIGEIHLRLLNLASFAARVPGAWLLDDPKHRSERLYESLQGISIDRLVELGIEYCDRVLKKSLFPAAVELVEANRGIGLQPALISESPDFVVAPLCRHLGIEHFAANRLIVAKARATGRLATCMVAESRADWCVAFAAQRNLDPRACWAYANSYSDLSLLSALGHPVAANPDRKLRAAAMNRQWPILTFDHSEHAASKALSANVLEFSRRRADGAA